MAARPRLARLSVLAAVLAATLFRALPLQANRFHPDEALYASFARRIASGQDVMLAGVIVDKPPLSFYLTALSMLGVGQNELGARLPGLWASLLTLPLAYALARRLYAPGTGALAAWLLALSPFAILFSITVFTDPLLTALVTWGLWMAAARRRRHAGLAFGLAFAVKQTALVFVPLAVLLDCLALAPEADARAAALQVWRATRSLLVGLLLSALVVFAWDALRHASIGFWQQGYSDNWPGRLIRANEVLPRARAWLNLLHYFSASTAFDLIALLGLSALLLIDLSHPSRAAAADFVLAGFALLHLAAYWLLAFAVFDRYLVPLLPVVGLLAARALHLIGFSFAQTLFRLARRAGPLNLRLGGWVARWVPAALGLLLVPGALTAARSGYPVGGDHGAYAGIDDAARFVHTLPYGSVLYDHWLSWEWNFYLFDGPAYVAWIPSPEDLTADLRSFGRASPRYFAVPAWEADAEMRRAAGQAGFQFVPVHTARRPDGSESIVVYQLVPE